MRSVPRSLAVNLHQLRVVDLVSERGIDGRDVDLESVCRQLNARSETRGEIRDELVRGRCVTRSKTPCRNQFGVGIRCERRMGRAVQKVLLMTFVWLVSGATGFCQDDRVFSAPGPQPSKGPATQSAWHITWVPAYLWLSGVDGNLGVAGQTIPVSATFSDVFEALNIGYMTVPSRALHPLDSSSRLPSVTRQVPYYVSADCKHTPCEEVAREI